MKPGKKLLYGERSDKMDIAILLIEAVSLLAMGIAIIWVIHLIIKAVKGFF